MNLCSSTFSTASVSNTMQHTARNITLAAIFFLLLIVSGAYIYSALYTRPTSTSANDTASMKSSAPAGFSPFNRSVPSVNSVSVQSPTTYSNNGYSSSASAQGSAPASSYTHSSQNTARESAPAGISQTSSNSFINQITSGTQFSQNLLDSTQNSYSFPSSPSLQIPFTSTQPSVSNTGANSSWSAPVYNPTIGQTSNAPAVPTTPTIPPFPTYSYTQTPSNSSSGTITGNQSSSAPIGTSGSGGKNGSNGGTSGGSSGSGIIGSVVGGVAGGVAGGIIGGALGGNLGGGGGLGGGNFGGKVTDITYCTCMASVMLDIDDVRGQSISLVYTPGVSTLYANYDIYSTGQEVLGTYSSGGTCLVYEGEDCNSEGNPTGTITKIGTN